MLPKMHGVEKMGKIINTHVACSFGCGSSDGMTEYDNGRYCFSCQSYSNKKVIWQENKLAKQESRMRDEVFIADPKQFPLSVLRWLSNMYIYDKQIEKIGIKAVRTHSSEKLILPIINWDGDPIGYQDREFKYERGAKWLTVFYKDDTVKLSWHLGENPKSRTLVVTEDILSAVACSTITPSVSLLGTSVTDKSFNELIYYARACYDKVVVWLDGDTPGRVASAKLVNRIAQFCYVKSICTKLDPKKYSPSEIAGYLEEV